MKTTLKFSLISVAVLVVGFSCYRGGYDTAETEYKLKMAELANEQKSAIIESQRIEKEKYERKEKELVARYSTERKRYDNRMRQLEAKLRSGGDLEAVTGERDRCLALAVRGERLLGRADGFIESLIEK